MSRGRVGKRRENHRDTDAGDRGRGEAGLSSGSCGTPGRSGRRRVLRFPDRCRCGKLDYRATALVQKASGVGGGILCTYETDGKVRFREHTSEEAPLAFSELPSEEVSGGDSTAGVAQEVLLRLGMTPTGRTNSTWYSRPGTRRRAACLPERVVGMSARRKSSVASRCCRPLRAVWRGLDFGSATC